ncbi:ATP-binding cassette subfamily B protein [Paucibacter oligotrophus]|uniref:ATP-binding cassette subfamily B protein n=1 Tax=Roseateles oligotrophus TaxID=1769250 RepID=A0A840LDB2_9BURK|nr:ABC transporter ATP-binding protein [Roseateles oligotrophus]MBB4846150.1 ATP-binding cassette subfamily B protein [Roseateles oligotrophus]
MFELLDKLCPGAWRQMARQHLPWLLLDGLLSALPFGVFLLLVERLLAGPSQLAQWLPLCALIWGLLLARTWVARQVCLLTHGWGVHLAEGLRLRLAERLLAWPVGRMLQRDGGELSAVLLQDVDHAEQAFSHLYGPLVSSLLMCGFLLLAMATQDLALTAAMAAGLALGLPAWALLRRQGLAQADRWLDANAQAQAATLEYLEGLRTLKAHGMAGARFARVDQALRRQSRESLALEWRAALGPLSFISLLELGLPLLMLVGLWRWQGGAVGLPLLLTFLLVCMRLHRSLSLMVLGLAQSEVMLRSARRIAALLDEPVQADGSQQPAWAGPLQISLRDLSFGYGGAEQVLSQLSGELPAGSLTALVGPSGSGKSTLARLLARFWDAPPGTVLLDGVDIRSYELAALQQRIAIVFQHPQLLTGTVAANLRLASPEATQAELEEACRQAACHDFILALPQGYETELSEQGAELSGGQKQRLCIARALLKRAPLVLVDEATASLDPENEALIQQALQALARHSTVLMIAHRLHTVVAADQIWVLERGRIVQRGRHAQLLGQPGLYQTLWQAQQQGRDWAPGVAAQA